MTLTGTATDTVDGTDAVVFTEGGKTVTADTVFGLGSHTVLATATDAAKNVGTQSLTFTVVDTTKPVVTASAPATVEATSSAGAKVLLTGSAADTVDGTDTVVFTEGGKVVTSGSTFGLGQHTVLASATDAAGNVGTKAISFAVVDTTAPAVPTLALVNDTGISATDHLTRDARIAVTPAESGGTLRYVVDGGAAAASYDPSQLTQGAHTVAVTQTDASGNVSVAASLAFVLDSVAPTARADAASGTGLAALTGQLFANDTDASGLHLVSVQLGNGVVRAVPTSGSVQAFDPNGTLTVSASGSYSYSPTAPGHTVFTETVADAAGNTSQTTLTFDVAKAAIPAALSFGFALTEAHFDFSNGHDVMMAPNGRIVDLTGVATIAFTDGTVQERDGSPLVDDLYYSATNLDVWRSHVDPDQHYAQSGWHEGRNPNAAFSTSSYLAANPDVAKAGVNPLTHYDQFGWHEGRSPGANFSAEAYLTLNPDVAAAGVDPLAHYLEFGQAEGRAVFPGLTIAKGSGDHLFGVFDATYYLAHNPDVAMAATVSGMASDTFAFRHYLTLGAHEGRDPDAYFSTAGYLAANPDVAAAGVNPLLHYEQTGWLGGRDPSSSFHTDAYLAANPDVAAARIDPLQHYLEFGLAEGRHLA
ncbi:hypothetical protein AFCDBAGC_4830 [Methylobacterium cerastii]|uniref:Bacterial Ig-like domain-containing protein n=1 Tax=Methylobacterium cerastii TaxID=932741 RepID=A0ABQ4QQ62_9HYPH|nr:hypothetical protein AFCDBAGC_4830 [Methylobacterium cerastii]